MVVNTLTMLRYINHATTKVNDKIGRTNRRNISAERNYGENTMSLPPPTTPSLPTKKTAYKQRGSLKTKHGKGLRKRHSYETWWSSLTKEKKSRTICFGNRDHGMLGRQPRIDLRVGQSNNLTGETYLIRVPFIVFGKW